MNLHDGLKLTKLDMMVLPDDLEISTITVTCKVKDLKFNVENIGLYFNDFDSVLVGKKYGNRIINNLINIKKMGSNKKNKINVKNIKKNFFNQVSLIFSSAALMGLNPDELSTKEKYKTLNIKLFLNGSIQMTGCKHLNNVTKSLNILLKKLSKVKSILDENFEFVEKPFTTNNSALIIDNVFDFKIQMININFNMLFKINRFLLQQLLKKEYPKIDVTFDSIVHPSVNVKYPLKNNPFNKTISIFIFESGSITIAGANRPIEVFETYYFINRFILTNFIKLLKKEITGSILLELVTKM